MMKVRQKISGTFRSLHALGNFCRIRGYVSPQPANSLTAVDALRRIFLGNPFLPTPPEPPAHLLKTLPAHSHLPEYLRESSRSGGKEIHGCTSSG